MDFDTMRTSVVDTLSTDKKRKYYVYALCERNGDRLIPFYIGKGVENRMWNHEADAEIALDEYIQKCKADYKKEYGEEMPEAAISKLSAQFRERFSNENQLKIAKINETQETDSLVRVIVKWGLTESEAFMAESTLINMLDFIDFDLTNKVRGHASIPEKAICQHSAAMTDDDFYQKHAREMLNYKDMDDCVFVSIGRLHNLYCDSNSKDYLSQVCDTARSCWPLDTKKYNPKTLIAVFNKRICGVYKITGIYTIQDVNDDAVSHYPAFPRQIRDKEIDTLKYIKDHQELKKTDKELFIRECAKRLSENEKKTESWLKRKFFVCENVDREHFEAWKGRRIGGRFDKKEQPTDSVFLPRSNGICPPHNTASRKK